MIDAGWIEATRAQNRQRAVDAVIAMSDALRVADDEIERLRAGLQLIAGDKNRLMNEVARQTAASILGGKPIGEVAEWPKRDATSAQLAEEQRFLHSAQAGCNHFPGQSTCKWCGVVQPGRCCLDYPRCDCNSPPEPDNEWHCSQYPGCECFAGCREKALEVPL